MIFLPLTALSQKATINLESKSITLDEAKSIDVAKLIENEKRLRGVVADHLETIRRQDSIIQDLSKTNISAFQEMIRQNNIIEDQTKAIDRLTGLQLKAEEKKNKPGSLFIRADAHYFGGDGMIAPNVGAVFIRNKLGISGGFGVYQNQAIYSGGVLINLF